eukprot:SAG31_NODE_13360_length_874_cov_1.922581_1_plen_192_part_00
MELELPLWLASSDAGPIVVLQLGKTGRWLRTLAHTLRHYITADVFFYSGHRLMHSWRPLKATHARHHSSKASSALTGYYMSPLDFLLEHGAIFVSWLVWPEISAAWLGKGLLSRFYAAIREIRDFDREKYGTNRESVCINSVNLRWRVELARNAFGVGFGLGTGSTASLASPQRWSRWGEKQFRDCPRQSL